MLHPYMTSGEVCEAKTADLGRTKREVYQKVKDSKNVETLDTAFPGMLIKDDLLERLPKAFNAAIMEGDYTGETAFSDIRQTILDSREPIPKREALAHEYGLAGDVFPKDFSTTFTSLAYKNVADAFGSMYISDSSEQRNAQKSSLEELTVMKKVEEFKNKYESVSIAFMDWDDTNTSQEAMKSIINIINPMYSKDPENPKSVQLKPELISNHRACEILYKAKLTYLVLKHGNGTRTNAFEKFFDFTKELADEESSNTGKIISSALITSHPGQTQIDCYKVAQDSIDAIKKIAEKDQNPEAKEKLLAKIDDCEEAYKSIKSTLEHPLLRTITPKPLYVRLEQDIDTLLESFPNSHFRTVYNMLENRAAQDISENKPNQTYDLAFILSAKDLIHKIKPNMPIQPLRDEIMKVINYATLQNESKPSRTFNLEVKKYTTQLLYKLIGNGGLINSLDSDVRQLLNKFIT